MRFPLKAEHQDNRKRKFSKTPSKVEFLKNTGPSLQCELAKTKFLKHVDVTSTLHDIIHKLKTRV